MVRPAQTGRTSFFERIDGMAIRKSLASSSLAKAAGLTTDAVAAAA